MAAREDRGSVAQLRRAGLNKPACGKELDGVKLLERKGWRRQDFRKESTAVLVPSFPGKIYIYCISFSQIAQIRRMWSTEFTCHKVCQNRSYIPDTCKLSRAGYFLQIYLELLKFYCQHCVTEPNVNTCLLFTWANELLPSLTKECSSNKCWAMSSFILTSKMKLKKTKVYVIILPVLLCCLEFSSTG